MNDEIQAEIDDNDAFSGTLLHLEQVNDAELSVLYANAAFCLYPSYYEGFGLPVAEAFARGKAVIASNGGALAELVEDIAPGLPPDNEEQWYRQVADWIAFGDLPKLAAARVASRFHRRQWQEVVADMLTLARKLAPNKTIS
jgi:glycosyltransferase involved in cell wall biosynthesis